MGPGGLHRSTWVGRSCLNGGELQHHSHPQQTVHQTTWSHSLLPLQPPSCHLACRCLYAANTQITFPAPVHTDLAFNFLPVHSAMPLLLAWVHCTQPPCCHCHWSICRYRDHQYPTPTPTQPPVAKLGTVTSGPALRPAQSPLPAWMCTHLAPVPQPPVPCPCVNTASGVKLCMETSGPPSYPEWPLPRTEGTHNLAVATAPHPHANTTATAKACTKTAPLQLPAPLWSWWVCTAPHCYCWHVHIRTDSTATAIQSTLVGTTHWSVLISGPEISWPL